MAFRLQRGHLVEPKPERVIDGRTDAARKLFARIRVASSDYDVQQFLGIFAFRRERDVAAIRRAFKIMGGGQA